MKFHIILISLSFVIISCFSSCTRYEEGANYSLRTAKMRITEDWTLTNVKVNGEDAEFNSFTMSIEMDDRYNFTEIPPSGIPWNDNGFWEFNQGKTEVSFIDSDGDIKTYTIIELRSKRLKLKRDVGADEVVSTFDAL